MTPSNSATPVRIRGGSDGRCPMVGHVGELVREVSGHLEDSTYPIVVRFPDRHAGPSLVLYFRRSEVEIGGARG